jgi:hypothetical protein
VSFTYADAIVGSSRVHKRKPADFYPTPPEVTIALLDFLKIDKNSIVWEPACGDGAISKIIIENQIEVISSDLRGDSGYGDQGVDFLKISQPPIPINWIITNPPFFLAEAFIRKSIAVAPNCAMLLKSQYWHAKSRNSLFEEHPPEYILALNWRPSFLEAERGNSPLMDVIWCIWNSEYVGPTKYQILKKPINQRFSNNALEDYLAAIAI